MKKYCLCCTIEREIYEPKFYDMLEEAVIHMTDILREDIIDGECEDEYLDEDRNIINIEIANDKGLFNIGSCFMWSNLRKNYPIDIKIFEVEFEANEANEANEINEIKIEAKIKGGV